MTDDCWLSKLCWWLVVRVSKFNMVQNLEMMQKVLKRDLAMLRCSAVQQMGEGRDPSRSKPTGLSSSGENLS